VLSVFAVWLVTPSVVFLGLDPPQQRRVLDEPGALREHLHRALDGVLPTVWAARVADALPTSHIVPGLDLQGGVQLTLKVDVERAIADREARGGADAPDGDAPADDNWRDRLRRDAVRQAQNIVKGRVDALHVAEPVISRRGSEHIQVQLPGSTDPAAARGLLGRTAQLRFHRVVDDSVVYDTVSLPAGAALSSSTFVGPGGGLNTERTVRMSGTAGDVDDQARALLAAINAQLPPAQMALFGPDRIAGDDVNALMFRTWIVEHPPALTGETIVEAQVAQGGPEEPGPVVIVRFDARGTEAFAQLTTTSVGKRIAIVLDDSVDSAPVVQEPITGGQCSIRVGGDGLEDTLRKANALVSVLKAGALLAPIHIVEERSVGPSLGQGAAASMALAGAIGVALVAAFMAFVYRAGGAFAVVAAVANVVLVLAGLAGLGAALTLPGIAGLILTVGMAVDANIVIQERIAEESATGLGRREATRRGYARAWSAILDSNVSSFIAGVVCLELGSGPVQSFAVTLLLGILATVVTAVGLTRLLHELAFALAPQLDAGRVSFVRLIPHRDDRDLLRHGGAFVVGSAVVVAAITVAALVVGVPTSVDFSGGVEARAVTDADVDADDLRAAIAAAGYSGGAVVAVSSDDDNDDQHRRWQLRFTNNAGTDGVAVSGADVQTGLAAHIPSLQVVQVDSVDGDIADDLTESGVLALVVTLLGILAYVAVRFDRHFAPGAVIALLHDPLGALVVFVVFRMELDLPSVAALLTTVGYSISHTIVIYDRVRETLPAEPEGGHPIEVVREVVRRAVNDTLQRTVATTLTVLFTTVAIWVWGGEALRSFAAALTAGCLVGAWSSLFVAPTIYLWLRARFPKAAIVVVGPSRADTAAGVV
jgi:protein-export membrane protein SecD/preprotein translocase SecF subunit